MLPLGVLSFSFIRHFRGGGGFCVDNQHAHLYSSDLLKGLRSWRRRATRGQVGDLCRGLYKDMLICQSPPKHSYVYIQLDRDVLPNLWSRSIAKEWSL